MSTSGWPWLFHRANYEEVERVRLQAKQMEMQMEEESGGGASKGRRVNESRIGRFKEELGAWSFASSVRRPGGFQR